MARPRARAVMNCRSPASRRRCAALSRKSRMSLVRSFLLANALSFPLLLSFSLLQQPPENLTAGRLRQAIDKLPDARHFVSRHVLTRPLGQLIRCDRSATLENDDGLHRLAPAWIGFADDRDFLHGRMRIELRFHFGRPYLE